MTTTKTTTKLLLLTIVTASLTMALTGCDSTPKPTAETEQKRVEEKTAVKNNPTIPPDIKKQMLGGK